MAKTFSVEEVSRHNTTKDLWVIIDGDVYDLTKFAPMHPGGEVVLREYAGKDATEVFFEQHRAQVLRKYKHLRVGKIEGAKPSLVDKYRSGDLSRVPYAEIGGMAMFSSPYYNDSHKAFAKAVREWIAKELAPQAEQIDRAGKYPTKEVLAKVGKAGLFAARLGPGEWMNHLSEYQIDMPAGVTGSRFDQFHELIAHAEFSRLGTPGYVDGLGGGHLIGLPPLMNFASPALKRRFAPEAMRGEKICCLAITEPFAGSDVAGVQCTAKKTPCGKYYVVNGVKKWITNGMWADYFITAVRTGGKGAKGMSLLFIEKGEGLTTKIIHTTYAPSAGTAYVEYKDVKVPVENLLGKEGEGFKLVMHNFNHERWVIVVNVLAQARCIVEDCFLWARQRKVFGKPLIEQPVIRAKLANMVAQLESVWAWLEVVTHQMQVMSFEDRQTKLGGPTALLKYQATRVVHTICDDAVQIMGGRSLTKSGMGARLENFMRFAKYGAVYGGSEEICADLGVRQAMKFIPQEAKM